MMKLGILGAGRIAVMMAKTINGMVSEGIGDVQLYAVASRDAKKASDFAQQWGVLKAFGSYEEMLADKELDLVYVATPHSHHAQHCMLCIQYGKAVLCEKAFTANASSAREVLKAAREKNVLVTEAIWTRYQPMRQTIHDIVWSGIVGTPKMLTANLSYPVTDKERIVDPALAGGALLDVGIYPINFAEMVFGRADHAHALCVKTDRGVDEQDSITLAWDDGRMAVLTAGVSERSDRKGIIYCTGGYIIVENINNPQSISVYDTSDKLLQTVKCPPQVTGYEYEVLEAAKCLEEGCIECPSMPHEETIHIMELMDSLRAMMGVKYPFE